VHIQVSESPRFLAGSCQSDAERVDRKQPCLFPKLQTNNRDSILFEILARMTLTRAAFFAAGALLGGGIATVVYQRQSIQKRPISPTTESKAVVPALSALDLPVLKYGNPGVFFFLIYPVNFQFGDFFSLLDLVKQDSLTLAPCRTHCGSVGTQGICCCVRPSASSPSLGKYPRTNRIPFCHL
jgi:hypothetical protein